jgi:hypothetical protein
MAIITVDYNTETKELSVKMDGKEQEEISYICFESGEYSDGEKYGGFNATYKNNKENGISFMKHAMGNVGEFNAIQQYVKSRLIKK